jgi:hypothetical protein
MVEVEVEVGVVVEVVVGVVVEVGVVVVGVVVEVVVAIRQEGVMRKLIDEVAGEGLEKLLGERVTLFCLNYIYTGVLIGVNDTCVLLREPAIVYETGAFSEPKWKDAQALPQDLYVMQAAIESFGIVK